MKKIYVARAQDEPSADLKETTISQAAPEVKLEDIPKIPVDVPLPEPEETEPITHRSPITPIDVIENIKLESYVNKTIVNDNNVVDVPIYQEKDKMLEEVRKLISEPPVELTTVIVVTTEATTIHNIPETTTEAITTLFEEETTQSTTVLVTMTSAPETETIFAPINNENNQNFIAYEDKISLLTTESPRVSL